MTVWGRRWGSRLGAAAVAAAALAGALAVPTTAEGTDAAPAVAVKKKRPGPFLTSGEWPTWYGMPGWEQSEVTPGKKSPGMYCATQPLPDLFTRHREFRGGPAYAMQHVTWTNTADDAARLAQDYIDNATTCTDSQLRKGLRAQPSIEFLGHNRRIGDGLQVFGVFYHVPAYGFIEPYDAMRLFAVGRVGRIVVTLELWRDGTRAGSRIKPFRDLAKEAVGRHVR